MALFSFPVLGAESPFRPGSSLLLLLFFVLLFLLPVLDGAAQQNPFISGGSGTETGTPLFGGSFAKIVELQRAVHGRLVELFNRASAGDGFSLLLLGAAFIYGALHALGPGHRKTILFSYFLSQGGSWWHGIAAGTGLAVVHAGSAFVMVWGMYRIIRLPFSTALDSAGYLIETLSYLLIAAMGILLLIHSWKEGNANRKLRPAEEQEKGDRHRDRRDRRRTLLLIVVSAGIVPCPGAATILLFGISLEAAALAVSALVSMSLGMALTLSAVGVLTLTMKKGILRSLEKTGFKTRVVRVLEVLGALFIFLFGAFMGVPGLLAFL
jgi:nickel/cobalt transporter (NicO) family protein